MVEFLTLNHNLDHEKMVEFLTELLTIHDRILIQYGRHQPYRQLSYETSSSDDETLASFGGIIPNRRDNLC